MDPCAIVVMLDALGVRNLSIEESRRFVVLLKDLKDNLIQVIDGAHDDVKEYVKNNSKNVKGGNADDSISIPKPNVITFGDTILVIWPTRDDTKFAQLSAIGPMLQGLIWFGLRVGLLLRGSISIGEYIYQHESVTVVGPAISDVAGWYEEAKWIGLIATPRCGIWISMLDDSEHGFVRYDVPLKSSSMELWSLAWPKYFYFDRYDVDDGHKNPKSILLSTLKDKYIPKGVEIIYNNTIKYFDWCVAKYGKRWDDQIKQQG